MFEKLRKIMIYAVVFAALLAAMAVTAGAAEADNAEMPLLSPGLAVIAEKCEMVVSGVPGGEVIFTLEDFERTLGYSPDEITITSRPDLGVGQLTLGSIVIPEGQTLSAANLNRLSFMPSGAPADESASFRFRADSSAYDYVCVIRLTEAGTVNSAPSLECATAAALCAKVPEGGICGGTLAASDPDGDALVYEITKFPKHGSVRLSDRSSGRYVYRPTAGYTGKDSFTYTVRDEWGNYAGEAEVKVTVSRFSAGDYADMSGSAETFARIADAAGLMSGTIVGGEKYFYPDREVTRSEFTVTLMMAAGYKPDASDTESVFADSDDIPASARPYVAKAYELGLTRGWIVDGEQLFLPNEPISLAEAAHMTARLLGIEYDGAVEVSLPLGSASWAKYEIAALCSAGFSLSQGSFSSSEKLDRARAAEIFCGVLNIADNGGIANE